MRNKDMITEGDKCHNSVLTTEAAHNIWRKLAHQFDQN